jgi:hypothetical protein
MDRIETMRVAQKIIRRFGGAPNTGKLRKTMGLKVEFPAGFNNRCRN